MNREQIVERVARAFYGGTLNLLIPEHKETVLRDAEQVLTDIGFFDLVSAVGFYHEKHNPNHGVWARIGHCDICGTTIPTISWKLCDECAWKSLDAAIAKITGAGGS